MKKSLSILVVMFVVLVGLTGCDREITGNPSNPDNANEDCFVCHNGLLDQAQGEWANSIHASGNNVDYTNRGGSDCTKCHDQNGYLQYWATGTLPSVPFENVSAIGCFTCHDPHGTGTMNIRHMAAVTLENGDVFDHGKGNQCASCHHSRLDAGTITDNQGTSAYWGPHHGPQGDFINGSGGYEFPGEDYEFPSSPHASVVTDACVGCHMGDPQTHVGYKIGGHSWNMVDEEDTTQTLVGVCANSSCHGSSVKKFDFTADEDYDHDGTIEGYQTEFVGLLDSLAVLLEDKGVLSSGHPTSGTVADGNLAGAVYNYVFLEEDRSEGVHNFNYGRSLLEASIDYVSNLPDKAPIIVDNDKPGVTFLTTH